MSKTRTTRRRFLQLAALAGVAAGMPVARATGASRSRAITTIADERIRLQFDRQMRSRVWLLTAGSKLALTSWGAADSLLLSDGRRIERFKLQDSSNDAVQGVHGPGRRLRLSGSADARVEKRLEIELFERYPGVAFCNVSYRNASDTALAIKEWRNGAYKLLPPAREEAAAPEFWAYCGSTHADRRDWVQPVRQGFSQDNFMGMSASDYGGGTPVVDVWRRDGGLALGHLELTQHLVSLPVRHTGGAVELALSSATAHTLAPGESLQTLATFVATHTGDYFSALDRYRRIMADSGMCSPPPPAVAYEGMWCAWGYERDCTVQLIKDTLPKVQELKLGWAVVDDGWQSNIGDWNLDATKFPGGDADMADLVRGIRARELKARLWFAPLAAAPGSDVLHDHTDMLLLDADGAPQNVTYWNSFYLCPAYAPTVAYTQELVRRFIGAWGYEGLKVDGQHLNAVAPCFNPAHHHARPEESVEKLQEFMQAMYSTALRINPQAVVEWCPCGTSYSFFNFPAMNQAPASDPESSWQVRHKGKTLKALMGPQAPFAGDHVELSDGGDDFASTVGVGAIVSTKFTWPRDPKPKHSFLLTPEKEQLWRHWITLYNEHMLPRGTYRGELYDIGFDKPEMHAVEKDGRLYYACYAHTWSGPVSLRGLGAGRYRVRDYFNDRDLGEPSMPGGVLQVRFERFLMLEAIPL